MPAGFQTWDSTGKLMVDMTKTFHQEQGVVDTGAKNGAVTMPGLPAGKRRWYSIIPIVDTQGWKGKRPGVTVSGNSLTWSYSHSTWFGQFSANCRITYGFF